MKVRIATGRMAGPLSKTNCGKSGNTKERTVNNKSRGIFNGEKGFTLIELLAVMAILAVLVAIVTPAVSSTKDASIAAQTLQDANQVRNGATSYFANQNQAEVRTPHTVTLTATINDAVVSSTAQKISSSWPEKFITTGDNTRFPALYRGIIPTSASVTNGIVVNVAIIDDNHLPISGATFLSKFTAIDLDTLVSEKLISKRPAGADLTSATGISGWDAITFLWLFEKTDSSADRQDDSRDVAVFQLVKVEKLEGTTNAYATQLNLSYKKIF